MLKDLNLFNNLMTGKQKEKAESFPNIPPPPPPPKTIRNSFKDSYELSLVKKNTNISKVRDF